MRAGGKFEHAVPNSGMTGTVHYSYYVTRTTRALELSLEKPLTAHSLAGDLLIDARTARRLLNRLADNGMLLRRGANPVEFVPGPRLFELGEAVCGAIGER